MKDKLKALELLSHAEINLMAAEEVMRERHLRELDGEITAVNYLIDTIRSESSEIVGV